MKSRFILYRKVRRVQQRTQGEPATSIVSLRSLRFIAAFALLITNPDKLNIQMDLIIKARDNVHLKQYQIQSRHKDKMF